MTKIHRLGVVLSLNQLAYRVRRVGAAGAGTLFYSEAIALAWVAEQRVMTGARYEITEIQVGL